MIKQDLVKAPNFHMKQRKDEIIVRPKRYDR